MLHITFTIRNINYTHSGIFVYWRATFSNFGHYISSIRTNTHIYPLMLEITIFISLISLVMLESHYTTM